MTAYRINMVNTENLCKNVQSLLKKIASQSKCFRDNSVFEMKNNLRYMKQMHTSASVEPKIIMCTDVVTLCYTGEVRGAGETGLEDRRKKFQTIMKNLLMEGE